MTMKLARLLNLFRSGWHLGLMLLIPAVLVACGGTGAGAAGGASASSVGGLGGTGDGSAQIQLTSDKNVLNSNKSTPVQLTAVVVDGNGVVVPNRPITWQVKDTVSPSGVRLEGAVVKTDASGKATASLVLSGDQGNRTVNVTVVSTDIQGTLDIAVAGTSISVSGPQTVPLSGSPSRFTINLKDSSGIGIAGKTLAISSRAGNTLSSPTIVTDQSGQAIVDVVGTTGGADILLVSGLGTSSGFDIAVASEALQVLPAAADIAIGSVGTTVQVVYAKTGGIPPGSVVTLTSTRGNVTPATASIASGSAQFTITSSTAGPVSLAATVGTTQGSASALFVATIPAAIDLQATPNIIGPNSAGQTSERSTLIAVVRDASGNPVKGRIVAFTNPLDPSGGRIDPATSITDAAGRATSTFIAGSLSTSPNGVQIQAEVIGTSITKGQALVSVSRAPLFVRIGAGDKVFKTDDPPVYLYKYAVVVSDSTGNAVKNAEVQVRLTPVSYRTGQLCRTDLTTNLCSTSGTEYRTASGSQLYPSEDVGTPAPGGPSSSGYRDGVCQQGEDLNTDRQLTPGNVASVTSSVTTDASGIGTITVTYPKQFGWWTSVIMEATIKVGGSEGAASAEFVLPVPAEDLQNVSVVPAFFFSPYPYSTERPTCP
jgi:hypothetical protein